MFRFVSRNHVKLLSGHLILPSYVRMEVRLDRASHGTFFEFKIDTGSAYTLLPMEAIARWENPVVIRRTCQKTSLRGVGGGTVDAYLTEVEFRLEDDAGSWAEWKGTVALTEARIRERLAGHVGFLEAFVYRGPGRNFFLEPRDGFPGSFHLIPGHTAHP